MHRSRSAALVLALAAGPLSLLVAAPAEAVLPPAVVASLSATGDPQYEMNRQRFTETGRFQAAPEAGFRVYADGWTLVLTPPEGQRFHAGVYRDATSGARQPGVAGADLSVGLSDIGFAGVLDVLDWDADARGVPSRFDIVFRVTSMQSAQSWFGEVRMGEEGSGAVVPAVRHLEWSSTPVGSIPLDAVQRFHNRSSHPVRIGAAHLTGAAAHDWALRGDACSHRTLGPGARCSLRVGFAPRQAGPRLASLVVPTDAGDQTLELAGTAPLGTNRFTTSGDDPLDAGSTHVWTDGGTTVLAPGVGPCGAVVTSISPSAWDSSNDFTLTLGDPQRTGLRPGRYAVNGCERDDVRLLVAERGTELQPEGVVDVRRFDLDANGAPIAADVSFTVAQAGEGTMTGRLQFRARDDYAAPAAPTPVRVSGSGRRTASWSASASADAVSFIARLVRAEADPATLDPMDGWAVSAGPSRTATFGLPRSGPRYRLVVFAVDRTGNVGAPAVSAVLR